MTKGKIILHPCHEDYCKKCIYEQQGECTSEDYQKNSYKVVCIWKRCKYRREKDGER